MKLSSITICVADNQLQALDTLAQLNLGMYLGKSEEVTQEQFQIALQRVLDGDMELKGYDINHDNSLLWQQLQSCSKH
jgi:hypothetical protein